MSHCVNKVILLGNATNDCSVVEFGGKEALTFCVATNDPKSDEAEYHSVVVWGDKIHFLRDRIKKGTRMYIEGKNHSKKVTRDDGFSYNRCSVIAFKAIVL